MTFRVKHKSSVEIKQPAFSQKSSNRVPNWFPGNVRERDLTNICVADLLHDQQQQLGLGKHSLVS